jgi:5-methyltetrahydropteroyltriglutamate--homocysteine methyltransferase
VVGKQIEAGLDANSNGEQQRASFVLYLRRRLSGIGGQGERAAFADIEKYPKFKAEGARLPGSDRGFHTSAGMGRLAEDIVWAKLRALVERARLASPRLLA